MKNPVSLLPDSLRTCAVDSAGGSPARLDEEIGVRVLHAWRDAQAGLFAIVQFGALLIEVEAWLKKRGGAQRGPGSTGLKAWLSANAPEVDYKTAMGYKYAASGLLALADKARDRPLLELMGEEPLTTEEENAAREQVREVIATSSLRLLKAAARAVGDSTGGPREGGGRESLLPEGPDSIRRAAAATWQKVASNAATFLSHKFALALSAKEAAAALESVEALRAALRERLDEERGRS